MNGTGHFDIRDDGKELWIGYKEDGSIPGLDHLWLTFKKKPRWLVVDWVSAKEEEKGKGVGRTAAEAVEQLAAQLGAIRIVGRAAKKSKGFWERIGYTVVPQSHQRPRIYKDLENRTTLSDEVSDVLYSDYLKELKTGAWKKQLNEMGDGSYLVEVHWAAWIYESPRSEQYEKRFQDLKEAEAFYDDLKEIRQARKTMRSALDLTPSAPGISLAESRRRPTRRQRTRTIKSPPRPRPASLRGIG